MWLKFLSCLCEFRVLTCAFLSPQLFTDMIFADFLLTQTPFFDEIVFQCVSVHSLSVDRFIC